jgi:hypothetical protein
VPDARIKVDSRPADPEGLAGPAAGQEHEREGRRRRRVLVLLAQGVAEAGALAALVAGAVEARRKDAEIPDVHAIREIAHRQVLEAAGYLVRHLMTQYEMRFLDDARVEEIWRAVTGRTFGICWHGWASEIEAYPLVLEESLLRS